MATVTNPNLGKEKETFAPASSFLEVVEYDPVNRTMDITFKSGTKTRYVDCPQLTFLTFKQSPTHSAFYARAIKGNLLSAEIINAGIGTQKSTPLKQVKREENLDTGLKQQRSREDRIYGTVARAITDAGI